MGWTDLAERIQKAGQRVFGEVVTYTPQGGSVITTTPEGDALTGVFDAQPVAEIVGVEVQMGGPRLIIRVADLGGTTPAPGDTVFLRGTTYRIGAVTDDYEGDFQLELKIPPPS
jgi:hypothetical protein